ncbi:MAG: hypothetical protein HYV06_05140 [Deltaproteobacteria bacterium]|nr:hypothetical protein [Deltaproteobacteria bacterium]
MNDEQRWASAVTAAGAAYERLPAGTGAELDAVIKQIMGHKQELVELALAAGSASICRGCGGECCLSGKYHVSVLDLLSYRIAAADPVAPNFGAAPACPYSGMSGCLMPPRFRPMTCVVFNCELIEGRMGPNERAALYERENLLREAIAQANRIAGSRLDRALLLSCDA